MTVEKGALEGAIHNIGKSLILSIGNFHQLSGRSDIEGSDLAPLLEQLIEIHTAIKLMEPTCKGIDDLLAKLGGRVLAPEAVAPFIPTDE